MGTPIVEGPRVIQADSRLHSVQWATLRGKKKHTSTTHSETTLADLDAARAAEALCCPLSARSRA